MRVLLIYPEPDLAPFYLQSPIGLLYLGAALEDQHEVRLYDANVDDQDLDAVVTEFDPDVIGVSFTTGCVMTSFRIVAQYGHDGRVMIAGGIHPTFEPLECLEAGFDIVARGEVEDTLSEFLSQLHPRRPFVSGRTPFAGYFYKGSDGSIIDTGIARSPDVNRFEPARHLLPQKYHREYSHGVLMGSRGCVFRCVFCASAQSGFRERDPKRVVDELEHIIHHEGHKAVHFADDIFTFKPKWVIELCQEIVSRKIDCKWSVNSRSDIPKKFWHMFDWMREAGCEIVAFGVESADQAALKASGKGVKVERIMPVLARARSAGLGVRCNLIVGLPGASYVDHVSSIDLMETILPSQIVVSLNTPYPGTTMGRDPQQFGIRLKCANWTTLLQNVYLDVEKFGDVIEYEKISTHEILQFVETLYTRLSAHGYLRASDDQERPERPERIIKTFLDKPKLPPLRDEAGRRDHYRRSSEPDWVL